MPPWKLPYIEMAIEAGGMHPTGMDSCFQYFFHPTAKKGSLLEILSALMFIILHYRNFAYERI